MTSPAWTIRRGLPRDAGALAAGNAAMARETEHRELDLAVVTRGVGRALADPARGTFWVAEDPGGAIAGQLLVTREWSDWRDGWFWWIQSVYVDPAWRRRGVFTGLYRHVEAVARAAGDVRGLRLYVERDNARARRLYEALGMADAGYSMLEVDWSGAG